MKFVKNLFNTMFEAVSLRLVCADGIMSTH